MMPSDEHAQPCTLVLFGATGDLTHRKLIPALFSLHCQNLLPKPFAIIAFARRDKTDDSYRADLQESVRRFATALPAEGPEWDSFARQISYHRSNFDDLDGYRRLANRLDSSNGAEDSGRRRLFYMATPADNFSDIVRYLGESGLNRRDIPDGWARTIIEKPFGHDLESARRLNADLRAVFSEDQIYRIDHYLGKETVQNILVLRFANQIFEPLWNRNYIESVRITVAETLGMEGRGRFFEQAGITRDIVQNHALQVLTLVAMEAPVALTADAIRDEKVKVLRSIHSFTPDDVARWTVRGQYGRGVMTGRDGTAPVPGYREEEGVAPQSSVETYAAFRFELENWRWAGVPFYVQAGKRLPERVTDIRIQFRAVPEVLFARLECAGVRPNRLTIRIQPDEGASLEIGSKTPGPEMRVQPVKMDFLYGSSFHAPIPEAYERLLLDAIRGDAALFARDDEVEAAWSLITPILQTWQDLTCPLFPNYAAGTWGPSAAELLLRGRDVSPGASL